MFAVFTMFLLTACATLPDEHCAQYVQRRIGELDAQGFKLIQAANTQVPDGTIIYGQFGNPKLGLVIIDATVDTPEVLRTLVADGFEETGKCYRGSHAWYTVTHKGDVMGEEG
jgi:hypothetical protein